MFLLDQAGNLKIRRNLVLYARLFHIFVITGETEFDYLPCGIRAHLHVSPPNVIRETLFVTACSLPWKMKPFQNGVLSNLKETTSFLRKLMPVDKGDKIVEIAFLGNVPIRHVMVR